MDVSHNVGQHVNSLETYVVLELVFGLFILKCSGVNSQASSATTCALDDPLD